jgi:hypothetical protein
VKKSTIIIVTIFTLVLASSAFAGDIIGNHNLPNNRGLVRVKAIDGNKMAFDAVYAQTKGKLVILTNVFADYDQRTQRAVYSEDPFCPDALKITFQNNGRVILHEAACAQF